MPRKPNRPERGVRLRDGERHLGTLATGDAGKDGYTRRARRARSPFAPDEPVSLERADRIEEADAMYGFPVPDDYY